MRVVVIGCDGAGSRSHYITGYHGPGCIWLDIVFLYSPRGLYDGSHIGPKHVVDVNSYNTITNIVVFDC